MYLIQSLGSLYYSTSLMIRINYFTWRQFRNSHRLPVYAKLKLRNHVHSKVLALLPEFLELLFRINFLLYLFSLVSTIDINFWQASILSNGTKYRGPIFEGHTIDRKSQTFLWQIGLYSSYWFHAFLVTENLVWNMNITVGKSLLRKYLFFKIVIIINNF